MQSKKCSVILLHIMRPRTGSIASWYSAHKMADPS
jgi:hypothetical protein